MRSARRKSTSCPARQAAWPSAPARKVFPTPTGPEEDHVLVALEEAEGEEILDAVAVEGHGASQSKPSRVCSSSKPARCDAQRQVLVVAPVDLVLERELEELELTELRLPRVRHPVGERRQKARELQALHHGLERLIDLHRHGFLLGFVGEAVRWTQEARRQQHELAPGCRGRPWRRARARSSTICSTRLTLKSSKASARRQAASRRCGRTCCKAAGASGPGAAWPRGSRRRAASRGSGRRARPDGGPRGSAHRDRAGRRGRAPRGSRGSRWSACPRPRARGS